MTALAAVAGGLFMIGVVLLVAGSPATSATPSWWRRRVRALLAALHLPWQISRRERLRLLLWGGAGASIWMITGWPVAGLALSGVGLSAPWLLGSGAVAQERIARSEALEAWCRRMADTLVGGGALGLAQAITVTAPHVHSLIAEPVATLTRRLSDERADPMSAMREFADAIDDRDGDAVAAAVMLALHEQSVGVARVLRQLAEGLARDVRARRDIESARAESRQSIKMLLIIQAAVLVMLAVVPSFAAPYGTPTGQLVMAILLIGTTALLVWMRRMALGRRAPRFLGSGAS